MWRVALALSLLVSSLACTARPVGAPPDAGPRKVKLVQPKDDLYPDAGVAR